MFDEKISRAVADGNFEETEHGLFVPKTRQFVRGVFRYSKRGEDGEESTNEVVLQGLNYLLAAALTGTTASIGTWYVAVFSGDVVVQSSWTASNFVTNATEVTNYSNANRPAWTPGSVAAGAVNSFAAKAEFQSTIDGAVIRGAAMLSSSTKSGTAGTLLAASRFPSDKTLDTDEILDVGYGIELVPAP